MAAVTSRENALKYSFIQNVFIQSHETQQTKNREAMLVYQTTEGDSYSIVKRTPTWRP